MIFRKVKLFLVLLMVFQLVVPSPIIAAAVGHFTSVVGNVMVSRADEQIKPSVKAPIQIKDLIITGDQSTAAMIFDDDSTITLSPNSRFEVREFTVEGNTRKGLFFMTVGRLAAEVKKFIGGDSSFEVHSPTAIAGVRGTGFEYVVAMVNNQLITSVTCTSGMLSVSAVSATGTVLATTTIVAGQTAVISAGGITVSTAAAGAVGTGATGTSTAGTTAGAGTAAGTAGTTAGVGAAAGISAGTVAVGVGVAAIAVTAAVEATGDDDTTTTHTHTTTSHH